jgi:hydrogenase 3 maturation protease
VDGLWILCVGNPLRGDDAVGRRVAELLTAKLTDAGERARGIRVVDCGTTPENYIAALGREGTDAPRTLLIVDAAEMGLPPGECRKLSLSELDAVAETSHGLPLSLLLAPFENLMEIAVLGIQPASLRTGAPLSAPVERAARLVAEKIAGGEWEKIPQL